MIDTKNFTKSIKGKSDIRIGPNKKNKIRKKKRKYKEAEYQREVVKLLRSYNITLENQNIRKIRFNASMNGVPLPFKLNKVIRPKMVQQGAEIGYPDLTIYAQSIISGKRYVGLAIELKSETGKLRPEQEEYLEDMRLEGWYCVVTDTAKKVKQELFKYITGIPRCVNCSKGILELINQDKL
jgi:hypothetical protein